MPYSSNTDLPAAVQKLPEHAQTIFRNAFNAALKQYSDETRAFRTAWAAVEKAGYHKNSSGTWVSKNAFA